MTPDPAVLIGIAIGVVLMSAFIVFLLGFEQWIRRYGRVAGPPNERHDAHCDGWKADASIPSISSK